MVSFVSETILRVGPFNITNTVLNTILVDAIIVIGAVHLSKGLKKVPSLFQALIETIIETFYNLSESVAPNRGKKIFPYVMSFFLFILIANWSGLIPGVASIGFFEHSGPHENKFIPLLRPATSELNTTLALAIISSFATHMFAINTIGIKHYIGRYLSLSPINLFIGILEIISEITKVVSLSFRLFGNIFAGEVVLLTVSSIFAFLFPVPFLMLEVIVGIVQALVFSLLTMAFMAILSTPHEPKEVNTI